MIEVLLWFSSVPVHRILEDLKIRPQLVSFTVLSNSLFTFMQLLSAVQPELFVKGKAISITGFEGP
jgi:hypothetical protein